MSTLLPAFYAKLRRCPDAETLLAMAVSESSLDPTNLWGISRSTLLRWGWTPAEFQDPEAQLEFMQWRLTRYLACLGQSRWETSEDAYMVHKWDPARPPASVPSEVNGISKAELADRLAIARWSPLYVAALEGMRK